MTDHIALRAICEQLSSLQLRLACIDNGLKPSDKRETNIN
jgi:hypothetical protein